MKTEDYSIDSIEEFAESLIAMEILTEEQVRSVDLTKILGFFQSPLGVRLCNADKVYREEAFNLLTEEEGEEIIVQGIIDCYFIEGDKCILIDFKSDFVIDKQENINALTDGYRPQLKLYKKALEKIRGIPVDEMYLYLFSIEKAFEL